MGQCGSWGIVPTLIRMTIRCIQLKLEKCPPVTMLLCSTWLLGFTAPHCWTQAYRPTEIMPPTMKLQATTVELTLLVRQAMVTLGLGKKIEDRRTASPVWPYLWYLTVSLTCKVGHSVFPGASHALLMFAATARRVKLWPDRNCAAVETERVLAVSVKHKRSILQNKRSQQEFKK